MANTVIAIKKSATPTAQPTVLANGELAINYADGKLFYKHANGTILPFNTQGGNAFGTVNANGTLVVAGSSEAVVTLIPGNNISISADAINDTITIESTSGGGDIGPAFDKANSANVLAFNTGIGANAFTSATIAEANNISIAAFNKANAALPNTTGASFAGNLTITGNVSVNGVFSIAGSNVSPVQSFRNKIINGKFDYWQRATSNTNVATNQYVADRWINIKTGTPTLNISRQSFTAGQTNVPHEPDYFYRANTVSSTGSANGIFISQRVESVKTLAGQTATLSFFAKADSNKNIAVEFVQNFGTNGSAEANGVNVTTFSLTSSWQKFNTTITLPSISGKTVDSANINYLAVNFWLDAGSNFNSRTNTLGQRSGTFDIAQVQLEAGSVATPFEVRPLGVELALCQRYFLKWHCGWAGVAAGTAYQYSSTAGFPVQMRATPTLGITSQTSSGRYPSSNYTIFYTYAYGVTVGYSAASSGGNDNWFVDGTASAEL